MSATIPPPLSPPREEEGNSVEDGRERHSDFALSPDANTTNRPGLQTPHYTSAPSPLPLTGRGRGRGERRAPSSASIPRPIPPPLSPPREGEGDARRGRCAKSLTFRRGTIPAHTPSSPLPLTGRGRGWGERRAPSSASIPRPIPPPLSPPREGEGNARRGRCAKSLTFRRGTIPAHTPSSPLPLTGRGRGWGERRAPTQKNSHHPLTAHRFSHQRIVGRLFIGRA